MSKHTLATDCSSRFSTTALCVAGLALALTAPSNAAVNLELRPGSQTVSAGQPVEVGLYAVSDSDEMSQLLSALQVVFRWDPAILQLTGLEDSDEVAMLISTLPFPDPHGLNEVNPPQDGDGIYLGLAQLGVPVEATPGGALVTTFQFLALTDTPSTLVEIADAGGKPEGATTVFSGTIPNLDITGTLGSAKVTVGKSACPADVNGDGSVDVQDLSEVILKWGSADPAADVNHDGSVDVQDLSEVIINWGPC